MVVWTFTLLAAATYILVFVWETLLFRRPGVHQGIFFVPTADVPAVRLWAFGVGFYNLFLGSGAVVGVIAWSAGQEAVGRTDAGHLHMFVHVPVRHRASRRRSAGVGSPAGKGSRRGASRRRTSPRRAHRRGAVNGSFCGVMRPEVVPAPQCISRRWFRGVFRAGWDDRRR